MSIKHPWFSIAKDEYSSMITLHREGGHFRTVCFLAQQICEKLFKGSIYEQGKMPPKIHDLMPLFELSGENFNIELDDLAFVSRLYIETRYPEDFAEFPHGAPDAEDAARAFEFATAVYEFYSKKYDF